MHLDVIDLREFYGRPLGRVARRLIARHVRALWPNLTGQSVMGLGYATPYLRTFIGEAERVIGLMPAQQGVVHWPPEGPGLTALAEETDLPLPDESVDRVLVVHGVENSEALRVMLRQIWRVLSPSGRVLLIVPNRRGLWARLESTPFGHGRPFSRGQLTRLLREAMFQPTDWAVSLFVPPINWRAMVRSAGVWERAGQYIGARFAGVILVEATKQIYAATPLPVERRIRGRAWRPVAAGAQALPAAETGDRPGALRQDDGNRAFDGGAYR